MLNVQFFHGTLTPILGNGLQSLDFLTPVQTLNPSQKTVKWDVVDEGHEHKEGTGGINKSGDIIYIMVGEVFTVN